MTTEQIAEQCGWSSQYVRDRLRRHRIPRREQPGGITERFPDAAPVTESFLRKAYLEIGLAATHIEQLTGQPAERILALLHASAVPVRSAGSFSPWYLRQRSGSVARPASRRRPSRLAIRG